MFNVTAGAGASGIAYQLGQNGKNLQRSLERLSTMRRINSPADDPGGLAVSTRLGASLRRTEAILTQVNNTRSFLQTQDGVLSVADRVVQRMGELASLSASSIDTTAQGIYDTEFQGLKGYLGSFLNEQFNGQNLFRTAGGGTLDTSTQLSATVSLTGETVGISELDLGFITGNLATLSVSDAATATTAIAPLATALDDLATLRALNGSQQSRVGFASELLETNRLNLEAANSRIVDLDFASELVNYTRFGILDQQNIALLAQANTRSEKILRLLE